MTKTIITTYVDGDLSKGTLHLRYCYAQAGADGRLKLSPTYSTAQGARIAAKRRGFDTTASRVACGHRAARRWLGLKCVLETELKDTTDRCSI